MVSPCPCFCYIPEYDYAVITEYIKLFKSQRNRKGEKENEYKQSKKLRPIIRGKIKDK